MGNICRSPVAEGHFIQLIEKENISTKVTCDSAGTLDYHVGELSDPRTRKNAESHGMKLTHRARQIKKSDFHEFDYILTMDQSNYDNIYKLYQKEVNPRAKLYKMRFFDPLDPNGDVPDPYYTDGFDEVYLMLDRSTKNFMDFLKKEHAL